MKKAAGFLCALIAVIIALGSFTVFAESTDFEIPELFMKTSIPNEMFAVTRHSKKTDSYFSQFGFSYKETMKMFKEANIYLQAIKQDGSVTLSVTMDKDKNSEEINNYNRVDDSELKSIMNKYLNDDAYKSGSIVKCNDIKYIFLTLSTKSGKKTLRSEQYLTVVNGMSISIILDAPAGKKITGNDKELLTSVIKSTYINDNNFFAKYKNIIVYGGITFLGILVVLIVLVFMMKKLRNPNRKHQHLVHELAHEHRISETTRIPRKKHILSMTKPTMSFLKNYKPADLIDKKKSDNNEEKKAEPIADEIIDEIIEERTPVEPEPVFEKKIDEEKVDEALKRDDTRAFEIKAKPVAKKKREVPLAEKIVASSSRKESEPVEDVPIARPMEFAEKKTEKEKPRRESEVEVVDTLNEEEIEEENGYFEEIPEEEEMYVYSDVGTAVDEYSAAKEESRMIREESRETLETIKGVFAAIGRGILIVLRTIWAVICFIIVHIKYFCVNVFRSIKRNRAKKKRMKIEEERRRRISEQRRREREAQRARRIQNANRGEGDLVKVRSSEERRPPRRTPPQSARRPQQRPPQRKQQRSQGQRRPQQRPRDNRAGAPSNRPNQNRAPRNRY